MKIPVAVNCLFKQYWLVSFLEDFYFENNVLAACWSDVRKWWNDPSVWQNSQTSRQASGGFLLRTNHLSFSEIRFLLCLLNQLKIMNPHRLPISLKRKVLGSVSFFDNKSLFTDCGWKSLHIQCDPSVVTSVCAIAWKEICLISSLCTVDHTFGTFWNGHTHLNVCMSVYVQNARFRSDFSEWFYRFKLSTRRGDGCHSLCPLHHPMSFHCDSSENLCRHSYLSIMVDLFWTRGHLIGQQ